MGVLMVEDDYELVGFDVVSDPSTHNAWFVKEDEGSITARQIYSFQ